MDIYVESSEEMDFKHIEHEKLRYDELDKEIKNLYPWDEVVKAADYQQ